MVSIQVWRYHCCCRNTYFLGRRDPNSVPWKAPPVNTRMWVAASTDTHVFVRLVTSDKTRPHMWHGAPGPLRPHRAGWAFIVSVAVGCVSLVRMCLSDVWIALSRRGTATLLLPCRFHVPRPPCMERSGRSPHVPTIEMEQYINHEPNISQTPFNVQQPVRNCVPHCNLLS